MELKDAVAIVTGGARGIGRGIACALAREGTRIIIADLPDTAADRDETMALIRASGADAMAVDVDVRDSAQTKAMARAVTERWGSIDVLVNNAGVIRIGPVAAFPESDWDLVMDVNLKGTFLCSQAVAPQMMTQRRGRIINLSSIAGKHGNAMTSCYSATKFGVIGFTQSLAHEMAPFNVTVNAICPGEVDTAMWREVLSPAIAAATGTTPQEAFDGFIKQRVPLGRPQSADDIGQAAVYLCKADNVTGIAMLVAGGTEMG
jgi:NAD(P)-dependent dehydrogenase (short-subunit alcohol dehydrogenase family)